MWYSQARFAIGMSKHKCTLYDLQVYNWVRRHRIFATYIDFWKFRFYIRFGRWN